MTRDAATKALLWTFSRLPDSYVVVDLETTDLIKGASIPDIVSVGLATVENRQRQSAVELLCRPTQPIHPLAEEVHGFSDDVAATFPALPEQWDEIARLIDGRVVVIHNAAFDWTILTHQQERYGLALLGEEGFFCSETAAMPWARVTGIPCSKRGPSLDTLTTYFGVEDRRRLAGGLHGAAADAAQTADVVEALRTLANS